MVNKAMRDMTQDTPSSFQERFGEHPESRKCSSQLFVFFTIGAKHNNKVYTVVRGASYILCLTTLALMRTTKLCI
jgi:hypothetical protein